MTPFQNPLFPFRTLYSLSLLIATKAWTQTCRNWVKCLYYLKPSLVNRKCLEGHTSFRVLSDILAYTLIHTSWGVDIKKDTFSAHTVSSYISLYKEVLLIFLSKTSIPVKHFGELRILHPFVWHYGWLVLVKVSPNCWAFLIDQSRLFCFLLYPLVNFRHLAILESSVEFLRGQKHTFWNKTNHNLCRFTHELIT